MAFSTVMFVLLQKKCQQNKIRLYVPTAKALPSEPAGTERNVRKTNARAVRLTRDIQEQN